jgi:hypothetical protein
MPDSNSTAVGDVREAPLAAAFFRRLADTENATRAASSAPDAVAVAAHARLDVDPWTGELADVLARTTAAVDRHAEVVRQVLEFAGTRWWTERLAQRRQIWLSSSADGFPTLAPTVHHDPAWEAYAQRPRNWFVTSTATEGDRCGLDEVLALNLGDWDPKYPLQRRWLRIDDDARVYEINRAQDWQELVRCYPTPPAPDAPLGPCVSVDWHAASHDWDGVHLSFAGLLFASYVTKEVPGGVTYLWSWDTEQTLWLNQAWTVGEPAGGGGVTPGGR